MGRKWVNRETDANTGLINGQTYGRVRVDDGERWIKRPSVLCESCGRAEKAHPDRVLEERGLDQRKRKCRGVEESRYRGEVSAENRATS